MGKGKTTREALDHLVTAVGRIQQCLPVERWDDSNTYVRLATLAAFKPVASLTVSSYFISLESLFLNVELLIDLHSFRRKLPKCRQNMS